MYYMYFENLRCACLFPDIPTARGAIVAPNFFKLDADTNKAKIFPKNATKLFVFVRK